MSTCDTDTCTLDHDTDTGGVDHEHDHSQAFKVCALCYATEVSYDTWCVNQVSYDKLRSIKTLYRLRLVDAMVRGCKCDICGRETVGEEPMFVIIGDAI